MTQTSGAKHKARSATQTSEAAMITLWVIIGDGWARKPYPNMQAAMVAYRLLRADDHVAFVVIG